MVKKLDAAESEMLAAAGSSPHDRGFRVRRLYSISRISRMWDATAPKDGNALEEQMFSHVEHIRDGRSESDLLYELLLKSGFPLTTPSRRSRWRARRLQRRWGGAHALLGLPAHDGGHPGHRREDARTRGLPWTRGFAGNDQLKTNAVQIFKTKGIGELQDGVRPHPPTNAEGFTPRHDDEAPV